MLALLSRLPRGVRGAVRARQLSTVIDLKGIGQASDMHDVVVDGITVIKMEACGITAKAAHKNLPSLPPQMHVNWDYLMSDLDEDAKKEMLSVKFIIDKQQKEVDEQRAVIAATEPVDWAAWDAKLTDPDAKDLIATMKAELEEWTFNPAESNIKIDQFRSDITEMESLVAAERMKLLEEIAVLEAQDKALDERIANIKTITIAELMEQDPEMAAEIEEEIRNENWAV